MKHFNKFCFLLVCLLVAPFASATCNLTLTISNASVDDDTVSWSGCSTSNTGVQNALNHIAANGGGQLTLTGNGSLLVDDPLSIGNNTMINGDPNRTPYGMVVIGKETSGYSYRRVDDPIFLVSGKSNVTIWNINFVANGTPSDHNLHGQAIHISNSTNVLVDYNKIEAAVQRGVTITGSSNVTIRYLVLEMVRRTNGRPEGGVGIWLHQSTDCTLEYNIITGAEFYDSGPNSVDHRPLGTDPGEPTDLIGTYGGEGNRIQHNTISGGNAAGIFAAQGTEDLLLWDNTITYLRQSGIDVDEAESPSILANHVSHADFSLLSLANTHNAVVQYNVLTDGGEYMGGIVFGALYILWGSSNNTITENYIYGDSNNFAVYFNSVLPGYNGEDYPDPTGNTITGNIMMGGTTSPYYFGGVPSIPSGNTISPNSLY